jgi:hypothetical protein
LAECSAGSQEILIRVPGTASVVAHDYTGLNIADEVFVFMIYKNELWAAVHEDVVDLVLSEADVDGRYDCTGADDPL